MTENGGQEHGRRGDAPAPLGPVPPALDTGITPLGDVPLVPSDDVTLAAEIESAQGQSAQNPSAQDTAGERVTTRGLLGSGSVMAAGTVLSRLTGVVRDIAFTAALGFFLVSDAYSLGNTMPNVLYILVIGGALNAVFIPQLVRRMKEDEDDGAAYADRLITLVGSALLLLSILAVMLAPLLIDLYATSAYGEAQRELATAFARLCLPQIFFYGIYALLSQVLNARGRFGAPMFAPILNNVVAIATFLLFIAVAGTSAAADGELTPDQIALLGIGTTLGVALQALILIPVLMRAGYRWRPRFDWRGTGLGRAGHLAAWTLGLVVVNQVGYIVITRLATLANVNATDAGGTAAGLTTYQKADLIFMLPHSVITVSIVTALLPALSRIAHEGRLHQVGHDVSGAMRLVAALIVPIAATLIVVGPNITVLLFGYGAATPDQAQLTGRLVSVFVLGLLPFTLFYVLFRGFYAMEDTRTPFVISLAMNLVIIAVAVPLFYAVPGPAQLFTLAFGYVCGFWVAFLAAWILLARRLGGLESGGMALALLRMLIAGLGALIAMIAAEYLMTTYVTGAGPTDKLHVLADLLVVSITGGAVYVVLAWVLRVHEVRDVTTLLARRLPGPIGRRLSAR